MQVFGKGEVLYCEAMAVLVGLQAVLPDDYQKVIVESDSEILIYVLLHK